MFHTIKTSSTRVLIEQNVFGLVSFYFVKHYLPARVTNNVQPFTISIIDSAHQTVKLLFFIYYNWSTNIHHFRKVLSILIY